MRLRAFALVVITLIFPVLAQPSFAQASDCSVPFREIIISQNFGLAYYCSGLRLEADPQDHEAMLGFARSALELGQYDVAADFAQRSRGLDISKTERFVSFLISGLANARQEKYQLAKIYLRRAANFTQNDRETQIIGSAMSQVRTNSPWSFRLSFNIDPSSNVNGGSIHDTEEATDTIFTNLDEEAVAQPGIGYGINTGATHKFRLSESAKWENSLMISGTNFDGLGRNNYRLAVKSGIRFLTAGETPARWFASIMYERIHIAEELSGDGASEYYKYFDQTTFSLERQWRSTKGNRWSAYTTYSLRETGTADNRDAQIWRTGISYDFPLTNNTAMQIGGYLENVDSEDGGSARTAQNISMLVNWDLQQFPVVMSGRISYTNIDYKELYFIYDEIRHNDNISLSIGATPESLQFFGFKPTFGFQLNRNFSNISRLDTFEYRVYTRISSVF